MSKNFAKVDGKHYTQFKKVFHYAFVGAILYPILKIFLRIKVYGRENVPRGKSIIVASNHISYFDPPALTVATVSLVAYMAKKELFDVPVLSPLIQALGAFAVNREKLEVSTIKSAKAVLGTNRWNLGIFPEGTRIKPGKIGKINQGFAYLAKSTKSDILPVGITGAENFPGKMVVRIGKPFSSDLPIEELIDKWGNAVAELTGFEYDKEFSNPSEALEATAQ